MTALEQTLNPAVHVFLGVGGLVPVPLLIVWCTGFVLVIFVNCISSVLHSFVLLSSPGVLAFYY